MTNTHPAMPTRIRFACPRATWATGTALALLLGLLISSTVPAQGILNLSGNEKSEILSPEEAFVLSIEDADANSVVVHFSIQEGHYLYRDKINFESADPAITFSQLDKPPGKIIEDEFFGETATYRGDVLITGRFTEPPGQAFDLTVKHQGCADIGICYPPQETILSVPAPAIDAVAEAPTKTKPAGGGVLGSLLNSMDGRTDSDLLPPEQAFTPELHIEQGNAVTVRFAIEDGYYLYRDKTDLRLTDGFNATVSFKGSDEGKLQHDEFFGEVAIWRNSAEARWTIDNVSSATSTDVILHYQGCADIGVCYPPQTLALPVALAVNAGQSTTPLTAANTTSTAPASPASVQSASTSSNDLPEQDRLARSLAGNSLWTTVLVFFGLGLLLAFTPCVLPMVPILSGLILGQRESLTTLRAFLLSLAFVLSMAITYTVVGVLIGMSGENIQAWFQNPWILSAFALLFVLLALSMFGFYELQMPVAIQNRLNQISNNQKGGTWAGVIVMGLLSALVVGPCVTAPLVGALIFIADTGDAVTGGAALFALAMGMGAPLILIATSFNHLIPRSGAWMETVKAIFGVLMLGLAIWMLSRFLPPAVILGLSAALCIVSAVYLRATDTLVEGSSGWTRFGKGIGILLLIYGAALGIGALSGGTSLLKPLGNLAAMPAGGTTLETSHVEFRMVRNNAELDAALQQAAADNTPVMLDFYADWCVTCKEMEAFTFPDPAVQQRFENMVLLQADVTRNNDDDKALLKRFSLFGPPAMIFYDRSGNEVRNARVVGFMAAEPFARLIDEQVM